MVVFFVYRYCFLIRKRVCCYVEGACNEWDWLVVLGEIGRFVFLVFRGVGGVWLKIGFVLLFIKSIRKKLVIEVVRKVVFLVVVFFLEFV